MPKVNLDSDIKLILRFLPIPEIELLKQMTNEIKAARPLIEQIGFYRDIEYHSEDCDYGVDEHGEYNPECSTAIKVCECGINETKDLLKKYDEATK